MSLLLGLPESSSGRIRTFPLYISFHHGSPCSCITWGINNRSVGGCSSETWSHPIDMIVIINECCVNHSAMTFSYTIERHDHGALWVGETERRIQNLNSGYQASRSRIKPGILQTQSQSKCFSTAPTWVNFQQLNYESTGRWQRYRCDRLS
jgi:hypothetical protein